jgi:hypothetical protein
MAKQIMLLLLYSSSLFKLLMNIAVNYTLDLTSSSPAVLDSTIIFTATVTTVTNSSTPALPTTMPTLLPSLQQTPLHKLEACVEGSQEKEYIYLWLNSVDHTTEECLGGSVVTLQKTFKEKKAAKGQYLMMVIVKPSDHPKQIFTFRSTVFDLTGENGT